MQNPGERQDEQPQRKKARIWPWPVYIALVLFAFVCADAVWVAMGNRFVLPFPQSSLWDWIWLALCILVFGNLLLKRRRFGEMWPGFRLMLTGMTLVLLSALVPPTFPIRWPLSIALDVIGYLCWIIALVIMNKAYRRMKANLPKSQ